MLSSRGLSGEKSDLNGLGGRSCALLYKLKILLCKFPGARPRGKDVETLFAVRYRVQLKSRDRDELIIYRPLACSRHGHTCTLCAILKYNAWALSNERACS